MAPAHSTATRSWLRRRVGSRARTCSSERCRAGRRRTASSSPRRHRCPRKQTITLVAPIGAFFQGSRTNGGPAGDDRAAELLELAALALVGDHRGAIGGLDGRSVDMNEIAAHTRRRLVGVGCTRRTSSRQRGIDLAGHQRAAHEVGRIEAGVTGHVRLQLVPDVAGLDQVVPRGGAEDRCAVKEPLEVVGGRAATSRPRDRR